MTLWMNENKYDVSIKFFTFLVSPFLALFFGLLRVKTRSSFFLFFLIFMTFGMSFSVPDQRTENFNLDGVAYRNSFEASENESIDNYLVDLEKYISFTGASDFYHTTVNFIVSRCLNNYHLMFLVVSIVFAFFSLASLKFLVTEKHFTNSLPCFILLYLFMTNQIFNINAYRFFTAAWIAVYALLNILLNNNNKYIFLLLFTPFFHGSFFVFYVLICLYLLTGKFLNLWAILFFISFFISSLALELFTNILDYLPVALVNKYYYYLNESYVMQVNEGGSGYMWVKRLFEFVARVSVNCIVCMFVYKFKTCIKNTNCQKMYVFLLILMTLVNFTMMIPAFGSRFMLLCLPFIAYIWLVCFKNRKYNKYLYILGIMFLLHMALPFKVYSLPCVQYYTWVLEPCFFYASPLYLLYKYIVLF
ncbi:EpsG family protein [Butyricimonas paravirosa]|uniref:EpsG family protein n=1 Tax=Butyricimonas paravirosa TaxID=1472417 RepID=UPI0022E0805A|nr:EpsG family protein [Butyricimonas paravirosa]